MDNNVKQCPKCGCLCESDHAFCAKCGYSFGVEEYNKGYGRPTAYEDTLDGIPTAEVVDYIGKNSEKILPGFFKYSYGAKAGWNWPVFLLGLIGLPFVWFFYRKMYKVGAVVLAISVAIVLAMAGSLAVAINAIKEPLNVYAEEVLAISETFGSELYEDGFGEQNDALEDIAIEQANQKLLAEVSNNDTFKAMNTLSQLLSYLQTGLAVILPIFANFLYYKKALSDISRLNEGGYPNGYTVHSAGGTQSAAAVISAIGGYLISFIGATAIISSSIIDLIDVFFKNISL